RPTAEEAERWWGRRSPAGIAAVCGLISGNLELIDFDNRSEEIYPRWCQEVESCAPGLLDRLCHHRTPRPGTHVFLRCAAEVGGACKLATDPDQADAKHRTLIETKGEGGYGVLPGSPKECHEKKAEYAHVRGPKLYDLKLVTADERELLHCCARLFDEAA